MRRLLPRGSGALTSNQPRGGFDLARRSCPGGAATSGGAPPLVAASASRPLHTWLRAPVVQATQSEANQHTPSVVDRQPSRPLRTGGGSRRRGDGKAAGTPGEGAATPSGDKPSRPRGGLSSSEAAEAQQAARERAVLERLREPMQMLEKLAAGDVDAAVRAAKKKRGMASEGAKEEDLDLVLKELQEGMNLEPGLLSREDLLEFQKLAALSGKGGKAAKRGPGSDADAAAAAANPFDSDGPLRSSGGESEVDSDWETVMREGEAEWRRMAGELRGRGEGARRRSTSVARAAPAAAVKQPTAADVEAKPRVPSPAITTPSVAAPGTAAGAARRPDSDDDDVASPPAAPKGKPVDPVWGLWSMPAGVAAAKPAAAARAPPAAAPAPAARAVADSILGQLGELDASRASASALVHAEADAQGVGLTDLSAQPQQQPPQQQQQPRGGRDAARRGGRRGGATAAEAAPAAPEDEDVVDVVDVVKPLPRPPAAPDVVVGEVVPPGTPLTSDARALARHKRETRDSLRAAGGEDSAASPTAPAAGDALASRGLDPATRAARARAAALASSGFAPLEGNASDTLSEEVDAGGSEEVGSDGKVTAPGWEGLLPPEAEAHDPDTARGRRVRSRARRRIEEREAALMSAGRGNPGVVPSNATPAAMARAAAAATRLPMPQAWEDSEEVAERLGSEEEEALRDSGFLVFSEGETAGSTSEEEAAIQQQHEAMLTKVRAAEAEAMRQDAAAASRTARLPAGSSLVGSGGAPLAQLTAGSEALAVQLPLGADATPARGAAASQFLARSLVLSPGHVQALLQDGAADAQGAIGAAAAAIQTALAHATPLEAVTGSATGPRPESHLSPLARLDVLRGVELPDSMFGSMLSKAFPADEDLTAAFTDPNRRRLPELAAYQASIRELRRRSELVRAVRTVLRAQQLEGEGAATAPPALAPEAKQQLARRLVEIAVRSERAAAAAAGTSVDDAAPEAALASAAVVGSNAATLPVASDGAAGGGRLVSPSLLADAIVTASGRSAAQLPPGTPDPLGSLAAMMGVDSAVLQRQLASIPDGLSNGAVLAPQSLDGGGIPLSQLRPEDLVPSKPQPSGLAAQRQHMLRGGADQETLSEGEEAEVQAMLEELGYWNRDLPVKERERAAARGDRPGALSQEERARAKADAAEHVATVERLKAAGDGEALARYLLKRADSGAGEEADADALRAHAMGGAGGLAASRGRRGAEDGLAALEGDSDAEMEALLEEEVKAAGGRSLIPAGYRNWTEVLAAHSRKPKREKAAEAALKREQQAKLRAAIAPAPPPGGKEPSRRQLAVGANLQRVIESVLVKRGIRDPALYPGGLPLEITEVAVTPDLRTAYVRWSLPFPVMDTRSLAGTARDEAVAILAEGKAGGSGGAPAPGGSAHSALVAMMQRNRRDRGLARLAAASMGGKKAAKQLLMMTGPGGAGGGAEGKATTAARGAAPPAEDPEVAALKAFFASQGLNMPEEGGKEAAGASRSAAAAGGAAPGRRLPSPSELVSDPVAALYSRLPGSASSPSGASRGPAFGSSLLDVDPLLALYHQPRVRLTPRGVADRFYGRDGEVGHLSTGARQVVASVTAALQRNAGDLRRLVAQGLEMRYLPKLEWHRYIPAEELGGLERTFAALEDAQASLSGEEEEEADGAAARGKRGGGAKKAGKGQAAAAAGVFRFEDEEERGRLVAMKEPSERAAAGAGGSRRRGGEAAAPARRGATPAAKKGLPWDD